MVRNRKPGFISAGALALLFTGLAVSVSLGRGLQEAARASAEDVQAIRAALVFEDRLIRADLGKAANPWSQGSHRVTIEAGETGGWFIRWWDRQKLREERWVSGAASY